MQYFKNLLETHTSVGGLVSLTKKLRTTKELRNSSLYVAAEKRSRREREREKRTRRDGEHPCTAT
jgi:rRNA processing protein Gar1